MALKGPKQRKANSVHNDAKQQSRQTKEKSDHEGDGRKDVRHQGNDPKQQKIDETRRDDEIAEQERGCEAGARRVHGAAERD